jgi:hypothetical protein
MSIESVESKKENRAKKGRILGNVDDKAIQGINEEENIEKPIRENVLNDVLQLREQRKIRDEIHAFGCGKYSFRDNNPWEDRYLKYIEENRL